MDILNGYQRLLSESININYNIEKIKNYFSLGFIMMHIDQVTTHIHASSLIMIIQFQLFIISMDRKEL